MDILINRKHGTKGYTSGELSIDGDFFCYTLEDEERPFKIFGQTAIPAGKYEVTLTYSNRFKKRLPLLLNVPAFDGIRMHAGNSAYDTEGCILLGDGEATNGWLSLSRKATERFINRIAQALKTQKVWVTIL